MAELLLKKPTCKTCKFFDRHETQADEGSCRESSPQLTVVMMTQRNEISGGAIQIPTPLAAWPNVKDDMWCGRYTAKWAKLDS